MGKVTPFQINCQNKQVSHMLKDNLRAANVVFFYEAKCDLIIFKPFQISLSTLSRCCALPFSHKFSKKSVCFQGNKENNKNLLLSDYHRQDTCTCYLSMRGTLNTFLFAFKNTFKIANILCS